MAIKRIKRIKRIGIGAAAGGIAFATKTLADDIFLAGLNVTFITKEIHKIISEAYKSEIFFRSSWKVKSRIIAKRILKHPNIQINVSELILAAIIYGFMRKNKNKQGNYTLAEKIADELQKKVEKEGDTSGNWGENPELQSAFESKGLGLNYPGFRYLIDRKYRR